MKHNPEIISRNAVIIEYFKQGMTQREITAKTGISKSTVQRVIKKHMELKTMLRSPGSGRRPSLSVQDLATIKSEVAKNPKISGNKLAAKLSENLGTIASSKTIRRAIHSIGLESYTPRKIALLSQKNIKDRFFHGNKWSSWPITTWRKVLYTDETKINLFSSDGRQRVWRKPNTSLNINNCVPTVKHGGGGIMVWGCMSYEGVGSLVIINGIMDRYLYKRIIAENLEPSKLKLALPDDFLFQQDNDPKHKSKYVTEYFENNDIKVMSWPSQSPDMNPIEHLWDYIKREVRKRQPSNIRALTENVIEIWNAVPKEFCQKLINSMPRRVEALVRAKGGPTRF